MRCFVLLLSLTMTAVAQQTPPTPPQKPLSQTFTARSELVLVPVIVRDRKGEHLHGLTKQDFHVLEDGKEQDIAVFEEITTERGRVLPAPAPADSFTNMVTAPAKAAPLTAVVFDAINTSFYDQAYARSELLRYMTSLADRGTTICIFQLTRAGVKVIHNCTSDPRLLAMAARQVRHQKTAEVADISPSSPEVGATFDAVQNFWNSFESPVRVLRESQTWLTPSALQQLGQTLALIPGPKALVWASAGFPFVTGRDNPALAAAYQRTWRILSDANVVVYGVDVRGVVNTHFISPAQTGRRPPPNAVSQQWNAYWDSLDSLKDLPANTGGKTFYNRNDVDQCFREASEDLASYYMLGYYLGGKPRRPGWHRLEVKTPTTGLELRARAGFFLMEPGQMARTAEAETSTAARSPLEYTAIPLVGKWLGASGGATRVVRFALDVPPEAAVVSDEARLDLSLAVVARDIKGREIRSNKRVQGRLGPEKLAQATQDGIILNGTLDLPPGEYSVRFIVRDGLTGRIGTVTAPLSVK